MSPEQPDSDEQLDAAPEGNPKGTAGKGRPRSTKRGSPKKAGKKGGREGGKKGGTKGGKKRAKTGKTRAAAAAVSGPTAPPAEIGDLEAEPAAEEAPGAREPLVAEGAAPAAERARDETQPGAAVAEPPFAEPAAAEPPAAGGGSRADLDERNATGTAEGARKRRARVAAYAHVPDTPHSARDLDSVAGLALELAQLSTPEARSRLLAEAVAHAEAKEARYRVPLAEPGAELRWKAPLALAIFLAAAFAAIAPPGWALPEPTAQLDDGDRLQGIQVTLLLQAQQVEAFRAREQRLPDALDEVAVRLANIRFVKSSSRAYQLVAYTPDGEAVIYDASDPGPIFETMASAWSLSPDAQ